MNLGLGAVSSSIRAVYRQVEFRRQVKLTVEHKRVVAHRTLSASAGTQTRMMDVYVVTATNMSPRREIVVRRAWFDTTPNVEIQSRDLPARIKPEDSWSREVAAHNVPGTPAEALLLARCQLAPDDKTIHSRPT